LIYHNGDLHVFTRVEQRHLMWSSLSDLHLRHDLPWLVFGGFNECMWSFEHFSSTPRAEPQMAAFRDVLELCGLVDLGFSGVTLLMIISDQGRQM
jgi:hypothetical protein